MKFKEGDKKPEGSGRKKGQVNRKTQDLMDLCESKGINVFEAMLELVQYETDAKLRFERLRVLAEYLYPKRKALEVSNADDKGFVVVIKDYLEKK